VAFLDADDYWAEDCLGRLREALVEQEADLAYCGWQNVGEGAPGGQPHVPVAYEEGDLIGRFLQGCPWPIHAALARRTLVRAVGGFSERYRTSMDYDFWLRIAAVNPKLTRVAQVLAYYRWHDQGQISAVRWEQVLHSWYVRREFAQRHPALLGHLERRELRGKIHGFLRDSAYAAYWKRDLRSAQRLFRSVWISGYWSTRDLRYLLPALLPARVYRALVTGRDQRARATAGRE